MNVLLLVFKKIYDATFLPYDFIALLLHGYKLNTVKNLPGYFTGNLYHCGLIEPLSWKRKPAQLEIFCFFLAVACYRSKEPNVSENLRLEHFLICALISSDLYTSLYELPISGHFLSIDNAALAVEYSPRLM